MRITLTLRTVALATLFALQAGFAHSDGAVQKLMTPADKARLDRYEETRRMALAEARGGDAAQRAELDALLAKPLLPTAGADLGGDWQCRTTKVGGLSPLVVYGWFKCRISDDGAGWRLEKTSGSQRTTGRFFDDGDMRLIYLGSFFVAGETPKAYGSGPDTDQVGYAFRTGQAEWRIELPEPRYESKLDILEFRR